MLDRMTPLLALLLACSADPTPRPARRVPLPVVLETDATAQDSAALARALARLPRTPGQAPDVLLIVLDTFRADRLAAYGGDAALAPRLNTFAEGARVYTDMRSNGTWTLPGHGSLFTGLYPMEHGARGSPPEAPTRAHPLRADVPTLAERLGEARYRRVGIAANTAFLDPIWGLSRGFDLWLCVEQAEGTPLGYLQADRVVALAEQVLRDTPEDQPLLLFLNFMDTHTPWVPREGYTPDAGRIDPALLPGGPVWGGARRGRWNRVRQEVLSGERLPTPRERMTWESAYNAEVRWLDAQLGGLLERLGALGHGPDDYTVIVADHGEYLGEHGLLEHSKDVYDPVLGVPFLARGPTLIPGHDPRPATLRDVPELILGWLGLPTLTQQPPFEPLQVAELYYARHRDLGVPALRRRFDRIRRAFVLDGRKLVLSSDGQDEAYDLRADPHEAHPALEAPWVAPLRAQAQAWLGAHTLQGGGAVELSGEQEERLRGLGYVE